MGKSKATRISVQGSEIMILKEGTEDYISLTDMAKNFGDESLIYAWMRNRNTVEFLGIWEQIHNPDFKGGEFETFKSRAGLNSFHLTPRKWVEATDAIGIVSKAGRYGGGTFAHKDIAFEFGSWLSPEFKLYLIKEFQRLKDDELRRNALDWNLNRTLAKLNYRIHTDAIKQHLIAENLTPEQTSFAYANEADLLNVALFGMTAKQWRDTNPRREGNIREYASLEELLVLANLESLNAELIQQGKSPGERLQMLRRSAIRHLTAIAGGKPDRFLGS